ncbi:MAG: FAD-binding oxidoreductase [Archaeoglobus sp.]|uniref:FAD-binding oxidoreductase n=1 Tax=Archaeoglobus sp. TaxID=1872626 RepID=UPI001DEA0157|nr:FAD-binding oxidoreductase [Archaeoglobus sp.]MBO8178891.1 FAD-binding oxidoreductase [Archaeoglobus sp.]
MDSLVLELSHLIKRVDAHPLQMSLYSQDLLKIPKFLERFIRYPICVVQPESDKEVKAVLKVSRKYKVPVVPRGAATSAYGGAVTIKPCIVVDLTRMRKIEIIGKKAVVESGAVWLDVENELNKQGLALRVYPSSAPAGTVGGWIAQGGYGIGSLKYGSVGENIEWLEVADFDGIKKVEGDELRNYVGLFGTTGVILRACLKLRDNARIDSVAIKTEFEKSIDLLDGAYHGAFIDLKLAKMLGFNEANLLLLSYEGEAEKERDRELGSIMWENRFNLFRAGRDREIIFTEAVLPYETAPDFFSKVEFPVEAVFTKDNVVFLGLIPVDNYYRAAMKAIKFVKIAERLGGRTYATGMLFPHKGLADFAKEYKKTVDPESLLNPGKAVENNSFSRMIKLTEMVL